MMEFNVDAGMSVMQIARKMVQTLPDETKFCIFNDCRLEYYRDFSEKDISDQYELKHRMLELEVDPDFPTARRFHIQFDEVNKYIANIKKISAAQAERLAMLQEAIAHLEVIKQESSPEDNGTRMSSIQAACKAWNFRNDLLNL